MAVIHCGQYKNTSTASPTKQDWESRYNIVSTQAVSVICPNAEVFGWSLGRSPKAHTPTLSSPVRDHSRSLCYTRTSDTLLPTQSSGRTSWLFARLVVRKLGALVSVQNVEPTRSWHQPAARWLSRQLQRVFPKMLPDCCVISRAGSQASSSC